MTEWGNWIGRETTQADRVDEAMAKRWCATLDRTLPDDGTAPQGLHWCLGLPDAATAALGEDGHPLRDDSPDSFLPPVPLPRRMWAASKVEFHRPLRIGEGVRRVSRVASVAEKTGNSGRLCFVEVAHETHGSAGLAVSEVQSIVYREAAPLDAPLSPPRPGDGRFDAAAWQAQRSVFPDERLLFRFSALTFNSHRIHYDQPYATGVERYRGLVVHGPLVATLLLDLARRELGENRLASFAFRAVSPAVCGEALHLAIRAGDAGAFDLAAFASDGREAMRATARA